VQVETVDLSEPKPMAGIDEQERRVSHQFLHMLRLGHKIRITLVVYKSLRGHGPSYAMERDYVDLDNSYPEWFHKLPPDMQITIPKDPFEPWVAGPFLGNLHVYYHLSLVMHHRPQIHYLMASGGDSWKHYMLICLNAAKNICRIHESMFQTLGTAGLSSMLRGMSFTIYAILTCTMLHLVSRTFFLLSDCSLTICRPLLLLRIPTLTTRRVEAF
jgi:hypothetical protein